MHCSVEAVEITPAEEMSPPPARKKKKCICKENAKQKKESEKALAYLQSIEGPELTNQNICRINKIVRDQKRKAFLSKKAKKLLTNIFSNASEEQRKRLESL